MNQEVSNNIRKKLSVIPYDIIFLIKLLVKNYKLRIIQLIRINWISFEITIIIKLGHINLP